MSAAASVTLIADWVSRDAIRRLLATRPGQPARELFLALALVAHVADLAARRR